LKLHKVQEHYKGGDCFTLYPIGDIHLGSANCDRKLLAETIEKVRRDDYARWIGMGDYAEWITPKDPRWAAGGVDQELISIMHADEIGDIMTEALVEMFRPIIGKCWGMGRGNHERSFERYGGTNLLHRLLRAFERPDLDTGWACLNLIQFEDTGGHRNAWTIYHAHGWQAGRTKGAKVNQAERMVGHCEADIYLHGHSHDRWVLPIARLRASPNHDRLLAEDKYAGHTGCFLRTFQQDAEGYGEIAEYPPTSLGPIWFRFFPSQSGKRLEAVQ
jgi:hypothetical protein